MKYSDFEVLETNEWSSKYRCRKCNEIMYFAAESDIPHANHKCFAREPDAQYRVVWEIDVWAKSPRDAAEQARVIQLDPASIATYFHVFDGEGEVTSVELEDPEWNSSWESSGE